jgi:recombination protein RecA
MAKKTKVDAEQAARDAEQATRAAALDSAISLCRKNHGDGIIMQGNTKVAVDTVSTGCLSLDIAIGVGGLPKGRIIEIYGPESSGKTTLALQAVAQVHRAGGTAAFVDAEHALDPNYASALGVDMDRLLLSQPDCGEDALKVVEILVGSGAVDIVVIDSVAALVPKAELDGEMGDSFIGLQARLMSQAMRKLNGICYKTNSIIIFINQIREKIGVRFGSPETTTGGKALKFYASVRLDIRRIGGVKASGAGSADEDDTAANIGNRVKVKVVKNKVAPPFKQAEFDIMFGRGVSRAGCILDLGLKQGIITKTGNFINIGGGKVNGRAQAVTWLECNDDIANDLEQQILQFSLAAPVIDTTEAPVDELAQAVEEEAAQTEEPVAEESSA